MKRFIFLVTVAFLGFSCENSEEPAPTELTSPEASSSSDFEINNASPLEELFTTDISGGFFYTIDRLDNAFAFYNGNPVCHADYPDASFKRAKFNSSASPGVYYSSNGAQLAFFQGSLSSITEVVDNCATRFVTVPGDCPRGYYGGAITYEIEECYFGYIGSPLVTSRDTVEAIKMPCLRIPHLDPGVLEIPDAYWELADGTKIDPWCIIEKGRFPDPVDGF